MDLNTENAGVIDSSMSVSRSGRVRKKSSKLLDFQSPEELLKDEKKVKRISRQTKSTGGGRVGRPPINIMNNNYNDDGDNINSDNAERDDIEVDEDNDDFGGPTDSDDELDELVADIVEGVDLDSGEHESNVNESTVRQSLYMSEKSNKRKVLKDGKIITSKVERKDKGKSRYTAYSLWAREFRKTSKFSKNQDLDFSNASRRLSELWANVSNKEKNAWRRKAKIQASKDKSREITTAIDPNIPSTSSSLSFANRATTSRTRKLAAERQKSPPLLSQSPPNTSKRKRYNSQKNNNSTRTSTSSATAIEDGSDMVNDANTQFLNTSYLSNDNSFSVTTTQKTQLPNIEPIDAAAHLKLLGESLSVIGERLKEHEGQIALSGSLSVLLDSILCSLGPLMCLTPFIPGLEKKSQLKTNLASTLDNIAYVMPGL